MSQQVLQPGELKPEPIIHPLPGIIPPTIPTPTTIPTPEPVPGITLPPKFGIQPIPFIAPGLTSPLIPKPAPLGILSQFTGTFGVCHMAMLHRRKSNKQ
jgi:hypothetical protein